MPASGLDPLCIGIDRAHGRLHELHTRFDEVAVGWRTTSAGDRPNITSSLKNRRRMSSLLSISHDVDVGTDSSDSLVEFQATEPRTQHHYTHAQQANRPPLARRPDGPVVAEVNATRLQLDESRREPGIGRVGRRSSSGAVPVVGSVRTRLRVHGLAGERDGSASVVDHE